MRLGCQCDRSFAGYVLPVMTRRGLRGIPSRNGLRGLSQDPSQEYANAVANYIAAGGSMTSLPSTAGTPAPPFAPPGAVNATGQTMADVLVAGGTPEQLGPTIDTSQTGAAAAAGMQYNTWGELYSAAGGTSSSTPDAQSWCDANVVYGISYCWWAVGGALALLFLAGKFK